MEFEFIGWCLVALGFILMINALKNIFSDNCERCKGLSRKELCNKYGHHSAAIGDIEYVVNNLAHKDKQYIIDRIKLDLKILEEVLKTDE